MKNKKNGKKMSGWETWERGKEGGKVNECEKWDGRKEGKCNKWEKWRGSTEENENEKNK